MHQGPDVWHRLDPLSWVPFHLVHLRATWMCGSCLTCWRRVCSISVASAMLLIDFHTTCVTVVTLSSTEESINARLQCEFWWMIHPCGSPWSSPCGRQCVHWYNPPSSRCLQYWSFLPHCRAKLLRAFQLPPSQCKRQLTFDSNSWVAHQWSCQCNVFVEPRLFSFVSPTLFWSLLPPMKFRSLAPWLVSRLVLDHTASELFFLEPNCVQTRRKLCWKPSLTTTN